MLYLKRDIEINRDHTGKSQSATVSCKCYTDYVTKTVMKKEFFDSPEATIETQMADYDNMTLRGQIDIEWFVPDELSQTGTSETDVSKATSSWWESFNSYQPIIDAEQQLLTDYAEFDGQVSA